MSHAQTSIRYIGNVVPQVHTWYPFSPCARSPGNLLLQDFSLRILRHFQLVDYRPPASGPFIVTFIARRPDANFTFGGRTMSMETESEILDVINDTPPVNGMGECLTSVRFIRDTEVSLLQDDLFTRPLLSSRP